MCESWNLREVLFLIMFFCYSPCVCAYGSKLKYVGLSIKITKPFTVAQYSFILNDSASLNRHTTVHIEKFISDKEQNYIQHSTKLSTIYKTQMSLHRCFWATQTSTLITIVFYHASNNSKSTIYRYTQNKSIHHRTKLSTIYKTQAIKLTHNSKKSSSRIWL